MYVIIEETILTRGTAIIDIDYELPRRDKLNACHILSIQPGQWAKQGMRVVPTINPQAPPTKVMARRSQDGQRLMVTMPNGDIEDWDFPSIKNTLLETYWP